MKAHRGDATAQNPQMEMLMKIMPYMLPIFAFLVQAALGVYFIASSLYRIAQQSFIHRTMKPITTVDTTIEAELIEEEPPTKEVTNQRSKKALAAQEERRHARAARSKERDSARPERSKKNQPKKEPKAKNDNDQQAIQYKRTSGDGRTKKNRK